MIPTLFIIGFILAGSDGPLFPWLNVAGCLISVIALAAYNHTSRRPNHG